MVVIECDRCGKRIRQNDWINMPMAKIEILESTKDCLQHIDLCEECQTEFWGWLKRWGKGGANDV